MGVNILFLPKAFRKNFEIEKFQDEGVDHLLSISTMPGKNVDRMQKRNIWIVSGGQTIQKHIPIDVINYKVCVVMCVPCVYLLAWFAKKLELFETSCGEQMTPSGSTVPSMPRGSLCVSF